MRREDGPRSVIGRPGNARRIWVALVVMTLCLAVAIGGNALLARYYIVATVPQGENILRLAVSGLRGELARYERLPDLMDRNPVLVRALADCCHPRAARLKARLVECQGPDQLALLKAEVLNLLTLSFGPAEAQRRLQPLQ